MKRKLNFIFIFSFIYIILPIMNVSAAANTPGISLNVNGINSPNSMAESLQVLLLITVIAIAPSILIMMTGFTRIVIVLSFVRNAIGLQQTPPNQVLVGLALFLTLFVMSPIISQINTDAYQPFTQGKITQQQAFDSAIKPLRTFMLKQTNNDDINLFLNIAKKARPKTLDEIPTEIIIPSFITSELRRAFIIGFVIFLPFLIIDMVVSSTLMSLGMVMLPPVMISLPFKILLFVLVDGWGLIIKTLITSFN
jgi:flagellar biosynthesis protein FliP